MKYIKIAIIVLIIIMMLILVLIFNFKDDVLTNIEEFEAGCEPVIEVDKQWKTVTNINNYYIVDTCTKKFFEYCNLIYNAGNGYTIVDEAVEQYIKEEKENAADAIYAMLDNKYIENKGITKNNILNIFNINSDVNVDIIDMYVAEKTETLYLYIVKGKTINKLNNNISDFTIMVKTDSINKTFSVYLQDYINENFSNLKLGDTLDIESENIIENNAYNTYDYRHIDKETYILDLFDKFKEEIMYNSELVYTNLNEEYKNKRFATLESFQNYAKNNFREYVIMKLDKYKIDKNNDIIRYICIDQKGNYYIFEETSVMKYKVILDTYTLDLPEFIEKYDKGNDEEKIQLNVGKILEAVNNQDYEYVYNKLDDTFKNNNFSNIGAFENYIKNNFYDQSNITNFTYKKEGSIYICTLTINNKQSTVEGTKSVTILIKLLENRDFDISFSL